MIKAITFDDIVSVITATAGPFLDIEHATIGASCFFFCWDSVGTAGSRQCCDRRRMF